MASRHYQLLSGHALTVVFLKKWGWVDSDRCWWCDRERQTREPLSKKREIRVLWNEAGDIPGKRGAGGIRPRGSKVEEQKEFGHRVRSGVARPRKTSRRLGI